VLVIPSDFSELESELRQLDDKTLNRLAFCISKICISRLEGEEYK